MDKTLTDKGILKTKLWHAMHSVPSHDLDLCAIINYTAPNPHPLFTALLVYMEHNHLPNSKECHLLHQPLFYLQPSYNH